jgi:hypothetical protein
VRRVLDGVCALEAMHAYGLGRLGTG